MFLGVDAESPMAKAEGSGALCARARSRYGSPMLILKKGDCHAWNRYM